jgi:hypothetical protein
VDQGYYDLTDNLTKSMEERLSEAGICKSRAKK